MIVVPGFDDRLHEVLEQEAAAVGESADAYIQRAVIARLMADVTRRDSGDLAELLEYLATYGADGRLQAEMITEAVLNDPERLRALEATGLLDSPREEAFDRIVKLAVEALVVPGAAVSLVDSDRQFFKSSFGLPDEVRETPVELSMCQYAVAAGEPFVIEDARLDPMLKDHPMVAGGAIVAYAGIPLIDGAGNAIGTLCVWDDKPRRWSTGHVQTLTDLAGIVRERVYGRQAPVQQPRW